VTKRQIRLSLIGFSGSGKSVSAGVLKEIFQKQGLTCDIMKLAKPLYDLQQAFYAGAGKSIGYSDQDQSLLEKIAAMLRNISATALVDNFAERLGCCKANVVINDDLRDDAVDWPFLAGKGFQIIRIYASPDIRLKRLDQRKDLTSLPNSPLDKQISRISADFTAINDDGLDELERQLRNIAGMLPQKQETV
jgi:dephospho-CoA kinase